MKENRQYKDSVFTDLFGRDEKSPAKALSLCNALLGTNYTDERLLENIALENVLYSSLRNDLAYKIEDKFIVLIEHQSTINKNMPRRLLSYLAREYEKIGDNNDRYAKEEIVIPRPKLFVLYNGLEDYPLKTQLRFSNTFAKLGTGEEDGDEPMVEIKVNVININADKQADLLERCPYLKEYTLFVEEVRKQQKIDKKNGFTKAVKHCIKKGRLRGMDAAENQYDSLCLPHAFAHTNCLVFPAWTREKRRVLKT